MDLVEAREFHQRVLRGAGRSASTLYNYGLYESTFLRFLAEHDAPPTLDALNRQYALEFQLWLRASSTGRRGGESAARQAVIILKVWSRFLTDNGVYEMDPLSRLKKPAVAKVHRRPFSPDEAKRLLQAAAAGPNPIPDRALLLLLFDTGCRVGELCATTIDDLDMAEGTITFRLTKNKQPRTVRFRVTARRDGGPCLAAVRQWLKVREAFDDVDTLFTTREKRALSTRRVRQIFQEYGRQVRIPNCHPHRTRHSAASEFLSERPGAENQLRSRLGHLSRDVLDDYITINDSTAQDAANVASLSVKWGL